MPTADQIPDLAAELRKSLAKARADMARNTMRRRGLPDDADEAGLLERERDEQAGPAI